MIRKPELSEIDLLITLYTKNVDFFDLDIGICKHKLIRLLNSAYFKIYIENNDIIGGLLGNINYRIFNRLRYLEQIMFYVDRNPFKVINTLFDDFERYAIENNVDIIQVTSHPGDSRNTLIRVLKRKGYETLGYVAKKDLRRGRSFRINR